MDPGLMHGSTLDLDQRWSKMTRDSLYSHFATRNVTRQFPLALRKVP